MIEIGADRTAGGSGEISESLDRFEASHPAMGTVFTVAAYGSDAAFLEEVADQIFQEVDRLDDQMSLYKPESELCGINREAARGAVLVEPALFNLILESLHYSQETHGAFDITAGPLMKTWGFFRGNGCIPDDADLRAVMKAVGYKHVMLDANARTIRFDVPGIELDLGGIGKGYAVERAARILRDNGVESALISSGTSSIYALGSPPGERGWRVSVRDPPRPQNSATDLLLKNISLSVSGNYEKFFNSGGKIYSHIVDPRSGIPSEGVLSTAVISPSATESEALSTAFFVDGISGAESCLEIHANVMAILYPPCGRGPSVTPIVLRSRQNDLAANVLAEISAEQHPPLAMPLNISGTRL